MLAQVLEAALEPENKSPDILLLLAKLKEAGPLTLPQEPCQIARYELGPELEA